MKTKFHRGRCLVWLLCLLPVLTVGAATARAADEDPADFGKLQQKMLSQYQKGDYQAALETGEKMHEMRPKDASTMYNLACLHCLLGHKDKAFEWLDKAVESGYDEADQLAKDDDFKTIRGTDRFREIVKRLRAKEEGGKDKDEKKAKAKKKSGDEDEDDDDDDEADDAKQSKTEKPAKVEGKDNEDEKEAKEEKSEKPETKKLTPQQRAAKAGELTRKMMAASEDGEHKKALKMAQEAADLAKDCGQPPLEALTQYNLACMYSLTEDKEQAFAHLNKAIDLGGGFTRNLPAQIKNDKDFDNIRKDPRFARALARAEHGKDGDEVKAEWKVTAPKKFDKSKKWPLVVALHPYNGGMETTTDRWRKAAAKAGVVLLAPQGTHKLDEGAYSWGRDLDKIEESVTAAIEKTIDEYSIDKDKIVIVGFSQGGWAAWGLAMRSPDTFRGVIPIAGKFEQASEGNTKDADLKKLRVYMMVGEDDNEATVDANKKAEKLFKKMGAKTKLKVYPDLAHDFPPDADKELEKALEFVLED